MRILLLGVGRWGQNHLRVLRLLQADLFVADVDQEKLKQCADLGVDVSRLSADWHAFIDRVDAAVIVTPAQTHFPICEELLMAGKDVFVEKPLSLSSGEAMVLAQLADKNNRILQVGHIFRYNHASQWLYKAIREGKFGHVNALRGNFSGFKRPRNDTGVAFADAIHFVDLFNYFMGRPPAKVTAFLKDFMGRGMEDESLIMMEYKDGDGLTCARVEAGYHIPGKKREIMILGTGSTVVCDYNASPHEIRIYDNRHVRVGEVSQAQEGPVSRLVFSSEEPLLAELRAFLDSVRVRTSPLADGRGGYEAVKVLEAAVISARCGGSIELDSAPYDREKSSEIPLSRCFLDDDIRNAILRVVDSGRYILDKECEAFEVELAAFMGVRHAVLCSSATMAIFMLHEAMGLGPGDEVLVPSHTAFASIEPLLHRRAKPVFIDIDGSYCLDVARLEAAVTKRTVGILPVHLYGHPVDMDAVIQTARKHHLWVIEDCAQAQGARYKGRRVGSMATAGVFSFYPSKNLTVMGDGGCICTDDDLIARKVRMLRNHGRRDKYIHEMAGYNLRFNEIQAAAGRVALRSLDAMNENRRKAALRYNEWLRDLVGIPHESPWAQSVYHMYVVRAQRRDALAEFLLKRNIHTGVHYPLPLHQQPAVTAMYGDQSSLMATEEAVKEILSLPIHGGITAVEVDYVSQCIKEFYKV